MTARPQTPTGREHLAALAAPLAALGEALTATVGRIDGGYAPGWRQDEMPLADALLLARERDLAAGYTSVGPHRADWKLGFSAVPGREALSRGQAKLVALAAILAQAEHFAGTLGEWPVVALDDLASELDRNHQARVLDRLVASGAQVLVSGTETPAAVAQLGLVPRRFHVEHGAVHDLGG